MIAELLRSSEFAAILTAAVYALQLAVIARAITRPNREPASRIAWVVVIAALPLLGMLAYLLLGETSVGRKRIERMTAIIAGMPEEPEPSPAQRADLDADVPDRVQPLFRVGESISGFEPVGGNRATLHHVAEETIGAMVADIDAAEEHVHLLFYIWLTDGNGLRIVEALKRAAARGVTCRALADAMGSRAMIASEHWTAMQEAGVQVAAALPVGNPLLRPFKGRIDLRNHRKIVVIDDWITYCGSQNCADAAFSPKPKFAPWVDAMLRIEGPVARQNQYLFGEDWMLDTNEDLRALVSAPRKSDGPGFPAQVVGTGPTVRFSAMPEMFESLFYAARRELVITTPYFVPDESILGSLKAAAHRGVDVTMIFPARNDSRIVGAASRSYYHALLEAGVKIFEYEGGLLHTKSAVVDGEVVLIGSANMDRRSFDLNFENNILLYDEGVAAEVRGLQDRYLASSNPVTEEMVALWPFHRRLWNNAVAMLGPVL